jgi:hypothetical protein
LGAKSKEFPTKKSRFPYNWKAARYKSISKVRDF